MLKELIKLFIRTNGRNPNNLELLQLKFKAAQQSGKGKVIEFPKERVTDFTKARPEPGMFDNIFAKMQKDMGKKPKVVKTKGIADKEFKDLHRSFRLNLAKNSREFNEDLATQIMKREIYKDFSDVQRKQFLDDLTSVLKEPLAGGGLAGMLGEPTYADENHRVPYGGGGAGKPPITFTLQGGGSYGSNEIGPGLDLTQSGYGFDLGTNIDLPFGFSFTGGVGIGRGKGEVDYNDQNVFTGVDETKLGDKWNVGLKWSKKFNEGGRVPLSGGGGLKAALKIIMEKFGKKSITTASKLERPLKAIKAEKTKKMFDDFNNKIATQEALTKGTKKMAGPIENVNKKPFDMQPTSTDATTWLQQEKFFNPKALDMYGKKVPANWIEVEKKAAQKLIDDLGPLDVSPNHPNYKDMKAIRQSAKDRLSSIKVTEALGGNITMHDWLRMNRKNLNIDDYVIKPGAKKVVDELSGIKLAHVQKKSSPWFKDPKTLTPEEELRREFPGITDDLIKNILADKNPQRIAEVKAAMKEALKMQEKGMGVEEIINIFKKKPTKHASGGRVPMGFGGRTIGILKNLLTKMKGSHGIARGEKSLKPDKFAKSIMSEEDKLRLLELETKYADSVLKNLKIDRQLFKQLETNREMKDQGLDFLMKHFVDTQAPHMKNYKSLADIDNAIIELETLIKNKTLKEGRKLNASGGLAGMLGE